MTLDRSSSHVVDVEDVTIAYGMRTILSSVTFEVHEGEIFGIIGPNGAGKTSTVECIDGLRTPAGGRIRVLGRDVDGARGALAGLVGVQLQEAQFPTRVSVEEITRLFRSFYAQGMTEAEVLMSVGLEDLRKARVERLSGGERQRLSVALALLGGPRLLCLDELTTGLDPRGRRAIWDLIERLRDDGLTIILTSHYMDEVERLCSRVALFQHGHASVADSIPALVESAACPHGFSVSRERLGTDSLAALRSLPTVSKWNMDAERVTFRADWPAVRDPFEAVITRYGLSVLDVQHHRPSLEDAFIRLTQGGENGGGDGGL